jgi:protein-tyrosine kinase
MEKIQRALELARTQRAAVLADLPPPIERVRLVAESPTPAAAPPPQPAPLLARVASVDRDRLRAQRIVFPEDSGPAAHSYRMLRAQLLPQVRAHKVRALGVVSAIDGEGKSVTATNLALSLSAEPNQTVLLVDLDLHKPSIASLLQLEPSQGLESWFNGTAEAAELFVRLEGFDRLRVLPAFAPLAGSSEALASGRATQLLTELRNRFSDRLVVIDLPPVLLTDDMLTVMPHLDAVLVVVTEGRTPREDLMRLRELLGSVRVLGSVLNQATESERRAY